MGYDINIIIPPPYGSFPSRRGGSGWLAILVLGMVVFCGVGMLLLVLSGGSMLASTPAIAQEVDPDKLKFTGFSHNPLSKMVETGAAFGTPTQWQPQGHTGRDFRAPTGTSMYAVGPGRIEVTAWTYGTREAGNGHGQTVIIYHGLNSEGQPVWSVYAHCSEYLVVPSNMVQGGQTVAKSGSTGAGSGPHLHFAVRVGGRLNKSNHLQPFEGGEWVDPKPLLPWGGGGVTEQQPPPSPPQQEPPPGWCPPGG